MKTNVNIFNALNESFENEMKAKRALKEAEKKEACKEEKVEETEELKEGQWNLTLDSSIRKAINDEDYDEIIAAFKHYNDVVQKSDADESIKEEFQRFIDDYELEFQDIEALEVDDPEESIDYILNEFWDLCDNVGVFVELGEAEEVTTEEIIEEKCDDKVEEDCKKESEDLTEDETVIIPTTEIEPDYVISDVTVLNPVGDGDVQAPDIEGLLTLVDESLKADYGDNWGHINILSSKINENNSFALVDISTPEIIKQLEEKEIFDAAIGKNLILENKNNLVEFKVNSLNGITRFSKVSANPQAVIKEWIETEFLNEAKQAKVEMEELEKAKEQKEVIEEYIAARPEMKAEIENIKMFIELAKTLQASEDMKPAIQNRMYGFAVELPANIEVSDKGLTFNDTDKIVEIVFGKEWVKDYSEIPGNEVIGIVKDSKKLTESYEQFNIGNIEVVFNPETYETLYSIPSADVKDKKINLTKVPSVDTPYDTNTIIKQYIETRFGVIPTEEEAKVEDKKEDNQEDITINVENPEIPAEEVEVNNADIAVEEPEDELHEDELPEEPGEENVDVGVDIDNQPEETTEEEQAETGTAVFAKIRPKQTASLEDIRERLLDGDTPTSSYIVVDTIDLSDEDWDSLTSNLTLPQPWLEGIKPIDRKNYSFNVVKVTNAQSNYALLIDPLGYNYPRYIAIFE